jgi:hypothetical protein
MRRHAWFPALAVLSALGGCSHGDGVLCEATARYAAARSVQPIQIPDDLSPPQEEQALRLPPNPPDAKPLTQPCIESPPSFYGEGRPTRTGRPADTAPAPDAAAPAENPERVIGN